MSKRTIFVMSAIAALTSIAAGQESLAKYEEPEYKVTRKSENIEFRQYPSVLAAEVEVDGTGDGAANRAFSMLAGYIFGNNVSKDKIAMTVPVTETLSSEKIAMTVPVTSQNAEGKMTMRFYMPAKYSLNTLPEPMDKRIKFLQIPAQNYAVISFSGFAWEDNIKNHEKELRAYLKDRNIQVKEPAIRAFYNPPWTLPFFRRNEVWLSVSETEGEKSEAPRQLPDGALSNSSAEANSKKLSARRDILSRLRLSD